MFRMVRTRIREDAIEQETPGGIGLRLIPGRPPPGEQSWADLFLEIARPRFYFDERITSIDSTPPGAELELFYLRRGGQLLYREGRAPLVVSIPSRSKTSEDDAILIAASLDGREKTRTSFPALSVPDEIQLELPPLENQLLSVAHGHLAGRSVLELRTKEPPTLAINESPHAYTVQIAHTGVSGEVTRHLASLTDPLLARLRAHIRQHERSDDTTARHGCCGHWSRWTPRICPAASPRSRRRSGDTWIPRISPPPSHTTRTRRPGCCGRRCDATPRRATPRP